MCYTGRCRWEVGSGDNVGECANPRLHNWTYLVAKGIWEADDPFGPPYFECPAEDGPEEGTYVSSPETDIDDIFNIGDIV